MWYQRFVNRNDAYAVQEIVNGTCQYFVKYEPLMPDLFNAHLFGRLTLGLPAIDQDGMSRWLCFDSDSEDGSLERIEQWLIGHGWHCLREGRRPGRDGHLWVFFQEPVPAADLRLFAFRVIEVVSVKPNDVEIFPKIDHPTWDADKLRWKASSVVRLPLGVNRKPDALGDRGWFDGTDRCEVGQALWLMGQPLNPTAPILEVAPELRRLATAKQAVHGGHPGRSAFAFGAPTAADISNVLGALGVVPPDDYVTWCKVGMALKSAGFDVSMWETWSRKSAKYKSGDCAKKWNTFTSKGNQVGIGTVFHLAKQLGFTT
jgi:hypothetical protein